MNDAQVAVLILTGLIAFYIGQCVIIAVTKIYERG